MPATEQEKRYAKRIYQERKEAGLCTVCGGDRDGWQLRCFTCRNKDKQIWQQRQKEGKCAQCGMKNDSPFTRCPQCLNASREAANRMREAGKCMTCGAQTDSKHRCAECKKERRRKDKERVQSLAAQGLCTSCGIAPAKEGLRSCKQCTERSNEKVLREKLSVFDAYGGRKCACCGEDHIEFLQLDHVNSNGADDRKQGLMGTALYRKLKRQGYPPGFQVLCANCNFAKGLYGQCPHQISLPR